MPGPAVEAARDRDLTSRSVDLAADLLREARAATGALARRRESRLRRLLADPDGTRVVFSLADRVLRPPDSHVAGEQLARLVSGPLPGLGALDRGLLRMAGLTTRVAPGPVVALATARLRRETSGLVHPAEPAALGRHLARLRRQGAGRGSIRPNLNLLGEAVLGEDEAARRMDAVESLLRRPDVDCVSVKVSSIASGLSLVDFEGSVARVVPPLVRLYRAALETDPPKLVNLDMEEHRDLELTVEVFCRVLGRPEFDRLTAGIALQAYLPDTHDALERLLTFSRARVERGGAPVRVRLVKGANLAMERVDAELHGWVQAPYASKAETDAAYKRLLLRLVDAAEDGAAVVGAASHNLFDVALALRSAEDRRVGVEIEMLTGMADGQVTAVARRTGQMLVYVPVTSRRDFRNALAYLARRLDENATPEGFLRHALDMVPGGAAWEEQAARFSEAVRLRDEVTTARRQTQKRRTGFRPLPTGDGFVNEPDTDLTVPENRAWAVEVLRVAREEPRSQPAPASIDDVERAVARARTALSHWSARQGAERGELLARVGDVMVAGRADAVAVMAAEAGKTFAEGDPEVSEAVDYACWYARAAAELEHLGAGGPSRPLGVVVVASPWNFPYAIPAGGVLGALAAGNTVLLKPSPEAQATAALLVEQLHAAGIPDDAVQLVAAPDGPAGEALIRHHDVEGVILTGSLETARLFRRWQPDRRLLAETSGKNAIVVAATADVDQAVRDVVRSAFGHAGQKCSAASIVILDASLHDEGTFLRQLADAVRSLRVGPAHDPSTEVGPLVGPATPALERALLHLDAGESWLVAPRLVDRDLPLWSPGVRLGVRPGSWSHLTEWFGPVLGVMRSSGPDEASAWQNAVAFGLTAGLHSLDPDEHRRWIDRVEAGNLYVNRPTTGAIVGRQPFGGWKGSSVGPTAKTGGPNYLIGLRRWGEAAAVPLEAVRSGYRRAWEEHFGVEHELAGLTSESNVLRYRPYRPGVLVRSGPGTEAHQVARAHLAAEVTGTPISVSTVDRESASELAGRLVGLGEVRLRLLGAPESEVVQAAAEEGMTVLDEPICAHGRIELVRWLREQVVTRSLHRYGNVVYER